MHEQPRLVVISGCSAGGKSTLIQALAERGCAVAREPGRAIVEAEQARGGDALPWRNPLAFLERCIDTALSDHRHALERGGVTFFDRSLIDAASALITLKPERRPDLRDLVEAHPYHQLVFMAPPWPALWERDSSRDDARRHTFADAKNEYDRLLHAYPAHGYRLALLPQVGVAERVQFVFDQLADAAVP